MYIKCRCPVHNKLLYGNRQTATHNLFKCPDCDYNRGEGAVRMDLPERYMKLERENKRLNKIIDDIEDWAIVSFDEPLLKLIKALKSGEGRK